MAVKQYTWDPVNDCVLDERDENGNVLVTYTYEPRKYGRILSELRDGVSR